MVQCYKTFCSQFMNFHNKLECLSLTSFSSLSCKGSSSVWKLVNNGPKNFLTLAPDVTRFIKIIATNWVILEFDLDVHQTWLSIFQKKKLCPCPNRNIFLKESSLVLHVINILHSYITSVMTYVYIFKKCCNIGVRLMKQEY